MCSSTTNKLIHQFASGAHRIAWHANHNHECLSHRIIFLYYNVRVVSIEVFYVPLWMWNEKPVEFFVSWVCDACDGEKTGICMTYVNGGCAQVELASLRLKLINKHIQV